MCVCLNPVTFDLTTTSINDRRKTLFPTNVHHANKSRLRMCSVQGFLSPSMVFLFRLRYACCRIAHRRAAVVVAAGSVSQLFSPAPIVVTVVVHHRVHLKVTVWLLCHLDRFLEWKRSAVTASRAPSVTRPSQTRQGGNGHPFPWTATSELSLSSSLVERGGKCLFLLCVFGERGWRSARGVCGEGPPTIKAPLVEDGRAGGLLSSGFWVVKVFLSTS